MKYLAGTHSRDSPLLNLRQEVWYREDNHSSNQKKIYHHFSLGISIQGHPVNWMRENVRFTPTNYYSVLVYSSLVKKNWQLLGSETSAFLSKGLSHLIVTSYRSINKSRYLSNTSITLVKNLLFIKYFASTKNAWSHWTFLNSTYISIKTTISHFLMSKRYNHLSTLIVSLLHFFYPTTSWSKY